MIQEPILKISEEATSPVSGIPVPGTSMVCDRLLFSPNLNTQKQVPSLPPSHTLSQHPNYLLNGPILYTF